jgi:Na+/H+ antiporter NhaD/arsenite permease-like protein
MNKKSKHIEQEMKRETDYLQKTTPGEQKILFFLGCLALLSVPVFKTLTHLPPYMGVLLALGLLWIITELMHKNKPAEHKHGLTVNYILQRIDSTTILFFLGILLAVGALETSGYLGLLAEGLNQTHWKYLCYQYHHWSIVRCSGQCTLGGSRHGDV